MSLKYYNTREEKICYVGWLLACDSITNITKGERYLALLPDDLARIAANTYAIQLAELYDEGEKLNQ